MSNNETGHGSTKYMSQMPCIKSRPSEQQRKLWFTGDLVTTATGTNENILEVALTKRCKH